jgi:hypothetical protein
MTAPVFPRRAVPLGAAAAPATLAAAAAAVGGRAPSEGLCGRPGGRRGG